MATSRKLGIVSGALAVGLLVVSLSVGLVNARPVVSIAHIAYDSWQEAVSSLQQQIDNLALMPGPRGPQGERGSVGPQGAQGGFQVVDGNGQQLGSLVGFSVNGLSYYEVAITTAEGIKVLHLGVHPYSSSSAPFSYSRVEVVGQNTDVYYELPNCVTDESHIAVLAQGIADVNLILPGFSGDWLTLDASEPPRNIESHSRLANGVCVNGTWGAGSQVLRTIAVPITMPIAGPLHLVANGA